MAKFRKKPIVIEATQWLKNDDDPYSMTCRAITMAAAEIGRNMK